MMKDTCCRSLPNQLPTGQRSSSKSSRERVPGALAKETSKHCLKRSRGSRRQGVIYNRTSNDEGRQNKVIKALRIPRSFPDPPIQQCRESDESRENDRPKLYRW